MFVVGFAIVSQRRNTTRHSRTDCKTSSRPTVCFKCGSVAVDFKSFCIFVSSTCFCIVPISSLVRRTLDFVKFLYADDNDGDDDDDANGDEDDDDATLQKNPVDTLDPVDSVDT